MLRVFNVNAEYVRVGGVDLYQEKAKHIKSNYFDVEGLVPDLTLAPKMLTEEEVKQWEEDSSGIKFVGSLPWKQRMKLLSEARRNAPEELTIPSKASVLDLAPSDQDGKALLPQSQSSVEDRKPEKDPKKDKTPALGV